MQSSHTLENKQFRFTQKLIDALPAHDRNSASANGEYSDVEVIGLKVSVSKSGHKSYIFRYRHNSKKGMLKLGEHPSLTVIQARQMANDNKNLLAQGLDPAGEKNKRRRVPTFLEFAVQTYLPQARLSGWRCWILYPANSTTACLFTTRLNCMTSLAACGRSCHRKY